MQSYISERLEIHRAVTPFPSIIYGTTGSPLAEWETEIIENDGGYRHAFQNREQAIGKWDVGSFTYNLEEWEYLLNFFIDKRGSAIAFRYKDYSDFEAVNEQIGVGDGANTTFYFTKLYGDYLRDITQLVNGTVQLYVNGVLEPTGFTIYYDVGIVVFNSAVGNGAIVTANFEFDVRVRFETDDLPATFVAFSPDDGEKFVDVDNMPIIETLIDRSQLNFNAFSCISGVPTQVAIGSGDYATLATVGFNSSNATSFVEYFEQDWVGASAWEFYHAQFNTFTPTISGFITVPTTGGNLGSFFRWNVNGSLWVWRLTFPPSNILTWNPSTDGEIVSISLECDLNGNNGTLAGQERTQLVIMQSNILYTKSISNTFGATVWQTQNIVNHGRCGDFTKFINANELLDGSFSAPTDSTRTSPNFSSSGSPVKIGFMAPISVGSAGLATRRDIDNLKIRIGVL
jgi:uncharacterized protein (TIGR02217 family)